jgi:Zn-dependent peptidase ImmA (M78 family)
MSLPNEIVFGSRLIKLDYIDHKEASAKKIFGEFDCDSNTLTIDKSLDNIQMTNTLLHELLHMIHDEYKLDLPESTRVPLQIVKKSLIEHLTNIVG